MKQNIEFERCIDFLVRMIDKYGEELLRELEEDKENNGQEKKEENEKKKEAAASCFLRWKSQGCRFIYDFNIFYICKSSPNFQGIPFVLIVVPVLNVGTA